MKLADIIELIFYSETVSSPTISAGALTIDCKKGSVFNISHNANVTSITISNPVANGSCGSITLIFTQDATGGRTITFPSSVKWAGGSAPSYSTTANMKNVFTLFTIDGGATWLGHLAGKDYA